MAVAAALSSRSHSSPCLVNVQVLPLQGHVALSSPKDLRGLPQFTAPVGPTEHQLLPLGVPQLGSVLPKVSGLKDQVVFLYCHCITDQYFCKIHQTFLMKGGKICHFGIRMS